MIATDLSEANLASLQTPRPGLLSEIPRGQRLPEHKLRAIGATYYAALDDNDGSTISYGPVFEPFDLPAAHVWKIGADHQMHEIEAMGFVAPSGSPTGW